jgi:hypothetical protein
MLLEYSCWFVECNDCSIASLDITILTTSTGKNANPTSVASLCKKFMVGADNVFVLKKPRFVGCCWIDAMKSVIDSFQYCICAYLCGRASKS